MALYAWGLSKIIEEVEGNENKGRWVKVVGNRKTKIRWICHRIEKGIILWYNGIDK